MFNTFLYAFLTIFIVTAIITIASLPGWVKVEEPYRKLLFKSLLLEVVACVLGFVATGIQAYYAGAKTMPISSKELQALLLKEPWCWQYSNTNWRTNVLFTLDKDKNLAFDATTYYRRRWEGGDDKRPIFKWKNVGPISISDEGKLEFDCVQTVLQDVKVVYGRDAPIPGEYKIKISLEPMIGLQGNWSSMKADGTGPQVVGGIFLNKDTE